ncbi:MAG TPA: GNAT family N-acetyltransferase [Kofleriaceae bacterium]|nr:GNAT family N-acetyltransferase [Kofleriaceae bacterium]
MSRPPDAELEQFRAILQESLNFPRRGEPDWLDRYDRSGFRLVKRGGRVAGGLVLLPCGQFYGGRRLDMVGFHAVAIAPERRGGGVGRELMSAAMRELGAAGTPLAALYPATQPIYRSVGFEQAGTFTRRRVPLAAIPVGSHDLALERVLVDAAQAAELLGPLHRRVCAHDGSIDRTPWFWRRLVDPVGQTAATFCVREGGRVTGYLVLGREWEHGRHVTLELRVRGLVAETPRALERLWTALADDRSLGMDAVLVGPPAPAHPLHFPEQKSSVDFQMQWMLRLVDVEAALAGRGYPAGLTAAVAFDVSDDLLEKNRGRFAIEVSGGRAAVSRGGDGPAVRIGVGALASLFGSYMTAEDLARHGRAEGTAEALASATAIFRGDVPWMTEMF